ncbi:phage holin family protein [Paracoccus liaowanqingii]|uniref:Phage holin family protein n=1 Tax=Paracoccus liaowanqingii TaxID=2560053 RepID=A0A4P7HN10_9RHOB|nr:phage holin family protein [Paracoccus liaowanqingii]QBX34551.1 phage holin family protein [Paracoccus liaowanqingii]
MFDFARRIQLAVGDTFRRAALKAAAGVAGLIASGFLLAALWSFLANELDWGSTLASLAIGGVLLLIAVILIAMSSRRKHEMPTTDDLKREVEARVSLATDAAVTRARSEATRMVGLAETKAHSLMDQASYRATKLADDAERKVFGGFRETVRSIGLDSDTRQSAERRIQAGTQQVKQAANSNVGSMAKLFGAFAVGVTLAAKIQESRNTDPAYDPDDLI